MKEKFRQFMTGRYGADQLSRFIMACGMVTLVCYMIFRGSLWYYLTPDLFWSGTTTAHFPEIMRSDIRRI